MHAWYIMHAWYSVHFCALLGSLRSRFRYRATAFRFIADGLGAQDNVPYTGPTVSGCTVDTARKTLTLRFNRTLLGNDAVAVMPYGPPPAGMAGAAATITSGLRVLINASYWCRASSISTTVPAAVGSKWCPGVCGNAKPPPGAGNCTVPACTSALMCTDPGAPDGGQCGGRTVCGVDGLVPSTQRGAAGAAGGVGGKPAPEGTWPFGEISAIFG